MVRRAEKAAAKHKKQKTRRLLVIGTCGLLIADYFEWVDRFRD